MTCIEDEMEEEGYGGGPATASRGDAAVVRPRKHRHDGLHDITNTESDDLGGRKARDARSTENRVRAATTVSTSGERANSSSSEGEDEQEEQRARKTGIEGKRHDDAHGDGDFDGEDEGAYDRCERDDARIDDADAVTTPKRLPNNRDNAASRLQAELEVDKTCYHRRIMTDPFLVRDERTRSKTYGGGVRNGNSIVSVTNKSAISVLARAMMAKMASIFEKKVRIRAMMGNWLE
jgi:hypothetical protein